MLLRKQLAQERLGWNQPVFGPFFQSVTPIRFRDDVSSATAIRHGVLLNRWIDDGTHDIYSSPRSRGDIDITDSNLVGPPDDTTTEMREIQRAVPVSVMYHHQSFESPRFVS